MANKEQSVERRAGTPPYLAFQSLRTLCKDLKQQGIPNRIDRSVLTNFSGIVGGQILAALRFFELIDDGNRPTERMHSLIEVYDSDAWAETFGAIVRDAYPAIFAIDLEAASPSQFSELFRKTFPGSDAVQRKAMTFFLNAVSDAQIKISSYITKNRKPRASSGKKRIGKPRTVKVNAIDETVVEDANLHRSPPRPNGSTPHAPNAYELLAVLNLKDMSPEEQAAVWTLIQYLKRKENAASSV